MHLAGQGKSRVLDTTRAGLDDGGYLMVVLLVGIAVTAVWMSSMLPSWRQQAVREKEAELVFRGEQYARAIALYYRKNQRLPPNVDTLVSQRYLRKKYLDPIAEDDFLPLGSAGPGQASQQPQQPPQQQGRGGTRGQGTPQGSQGAGGIVGISGVRSTSNETSIVVYQNQQSYSQFPFDYQLALQKMGVGQGGTNGARPPGGRGRGDEVSPVGPGFGNVGTGRPGAPGRGAPRGGGVVNPPRGGAQPGPQGPGGRATR